MVLTYLIAAACSLLPFFGFMTWEASGRSAAPHLSWQFLYLSPFPAFVELSQTRSFWTNCPPMLLGRTPFWLVTGGIYAFLATGFFTLVLARLARRKR
jgi:hypothetical protein